MKQESSILYLRRPVLAIFTNCLIFLVVSLCFLNSDIYAAIYHVRTDGHDTASGANDSADASTGAFLTIQKAVNIATIAGDIVTIHAGDYSATVPTITSKASGSPGNLITIQAHGSDTVTVGRIYITHNYLKINGLRIKGGSGYYIPAVYISGNYVQVTNNYMWAKTGSIDATGNGTYGFYIIGSNATISGNTIEGISYAYGTHNSTSSNTLTDTTKNWTVDYTGEKIYNLSKNISGTITSNSTKTVSSNIAQVFANGDTYLIGDTYFIVIAMAGSGNIVDNNIIKNIFYPERIFDLSGTGNTISNNNIYNIRGIALTGIHPDIFQTVSGSASRNNIIERNYFHDMTNVQIGNLETSSDGNSSYNWTFRNNVFANIDAPLFAYIGTMKFYNNTFYHCTSDAIILINASSPNSEFVNNIFISNSTSNTTGWWGIGGSPAGIVHKYNYVTKPDYSARSGFTETGGVNGGDPKFVAPYTDCINNPCNFAIQAGSTAIDKGSTIASFSNDYGDTTRPQGAAWDIGAYEFAGQYRIPKTPDIILIQ